MGPSGARDRNESSDGDPPTVTIRSGADADAAAAARLHADRITQGFLSYLGPAFLTRLYRRISRDPSSFLLVADDGGTVTGFIAGTSDLGRLYRSFLVRDGVPASLAAAPRLVRSWRRVVETLRHGGADDSGTGQGTELLAVAVDPACSGRGVGRALVAAFLDRTTTGGSEQAYVVVGADNAGAIALYRGAGFTSTAAFELHPGTRSLVMQWSKVAP